MPTGRRARGLADVVQVHELLAGIGTFDGRAVDELQRQIGHGLHELGDLADVGLLAANRLRVALPVTDDVVGEDVARARHIGCCPEGRPQLGAELRLVLCLRHGSSLRGNPMQLNYVAGNGDCDPADLSPGWNRVGRMALNAENITIDTTDPDEARRMVGRARSTAR